jgi:hypothetical protein
MNPASPERGVIALALNKPIQEAAHYQNIKLTKMGQIREEI